MLRKVSPTKVESDSGWGLSSGHHCWEYSEGDRKIQVFSEQAFLDRHWGAAVLLSHLPESWLPPHNIYVISEKKRTEIAANIEEGLKFLRIHYYVE